MKQLTSKQLPEDMRPYEKCLTHGPSSMSDAELLAVILRTGSCGENSVDLCRRLLGEYSLTELIQKTVIQLKKERGIGKVKAIQIQCIGELANRVSRSKLGRQISFQSPQLISDYYMEQLCHEQQEMVILLLLNVKNMLLKEVLLSKGTINMSLLPVRELFAEAFRYQAVKFVLLHNHPSGDAEPSMEDIAATKDIYKAGCMLGIYMVDHIIIGDHRYVSLKERGLCI